LRVIDERITSHHRLARSDGRGRPRKRCIPRSVSQPPRRASRKASGTALETVPDELRISKETAGNQLKAVFHKTSVHRQTELAALLRDS
jgi:hypothetical protein